MTATMLMTAAAGARRRLTFFSVVNTLCGTALLFFLVFGIVGSMWRLGINPKEYSCLPWRFYLVRNAVPATIQRGEIYRYRSMGTKGVPDGIRIGKYAAALPGDHVQVAAAGVLINGVLWGPLNDDVMTKMGLRLDDVLSDYVVPEKKVLMLGTLAHSYDGRYWGVVDQSQVDGKVYPLW